MTVPDPHAAAQPPRADAPTPSLLRAAIWVAIGALIAAAIVCVVWVLVGEQNGIVGRAFLTILLLAAFAGVAILDAHLAPRRPAWFALASMGTWVAILLIGAVMIWLPERYSWGGFSRFLQFLLIVLILQLALLHVRLYMKAFRRHDTSFTRVVAIITITLVVCLAVLLVIPLMLAEYLDLPEIYWRIVVAVAILAAVGTALIPLVNVLFAPKKPRPIAGYPAPYGAAPQQHQMLQQPTGPYPPQQPTVPYPPQQPSGPYPPQQHAAPPVEAATQELLPWPTFVDGHTPLPMLPDGSPDWNAYYTGYPTPGAHVFGAPEAPAPEQQAPASAPQASAPEQQAPAPEQAPPPPPQAPADQGAGEPPAPPAGYEGFPPPPPLPPRP
jgi:hypothetical protein